MSKGSDKRSVSTDALETLGNPIGPDEKRDAIHLAVEPVVAAERLVPGDHIKVRDGFAYKTLVGKGTGIVDPFLLDSLMPGERFWFVMYPRQVRSLRHVWSHPDFPDEIAKPSNNSDKVKDIINSKVWVHKFLTQNNLPDLSTVMEAIENGRSQQGGSLHIGSADASGDIPDVFWEHMEIILGKPLPRATHFSCSC